MLSILGKLFYLHRYILILQLDTNGLSNWAKTWLMEFNPGKYEVMHFCERNQRADYYLNGDKLQMPEVQRDVRGM